MYNSPQISFPRALMIFDQPWYQIIETLKKNNISISGGNSTKRHILSSIQYKLFQICTALGIRENDISTEYYSNEWLLNTPITEKNAKTKTYDEIHDIAEILIKLLPAEIFTVSSEPLTEDTRSPSQNPSTEGVNLNDNSELSPIDGQADIDNSVEDLPQNNHLQSKNTSTGAKPNSNLKSLTTNTFSNNGNKRSYSTRILNDLDINNNKGGADDKIPLPRKIEKREIFLATSPIAIKIKDILKDNQIDNYEKQRQIELIIHEAWVELFKRKIGEGSKYSSATWGFLNAQFNRFEEELNVAIERLAESKTKGRFKEILLSISRETLAMLAFKAIIPVIQTGRKMTVTNITIKIGELVCLEWALKEYSESKELKKSCDLSFHGFKSSLNITTDELINIGDFLLTTLLIYGDLIERSSERTSQNHTEVFIRPTLSTIKYFEQVTELIGFNIPMICKPVDWELDINGSIKNYGGYIRKYTYSSDRYMTESWESSGSTKLKNHKLIERVINELSAVPLRINKKVLDFILEKGYSCGLLLKEVHPLTKEYSKSSKIQKALIDEHNSKFFTQQCILSIAQLLADQPYIYFPVKLDWRGRIYSVPSYLTYQGDELAKALLEFAEGQVIKEPRKDDYFLKVYGANLYGLNQLSFTDRIKWVDENQDKIISLDKQFWLDAKEPLLFLSFCFEYKNYLATLKENKEFITHLPIQLDATCSGLQHLSAMIKDSKLAEQVNLLNTDDLPKDLYQNILNLIKERIGEFVRDNPYYIRLKGIELTRAQVKRSIMTIPYNITIKGVAEYLEESFEVVYINKERMLKKDDVLINYKELFAFAKIVHSTLFDTHPTLKAIVDYFGAMVKLLSKLGLPVIWITPSGLSITQRYVKFQTKKIKPKSFYKSAPISVSLPTQDINLRKQVAAFMPNLIHSMDSANIVGLIKSYIELGGDFYPMNIYTIHDCFATTSPRVHILNFLVRKAFIELYSEPYVYKLHKFLLEYIKNTFELSQDRTKVITAKEAFEMAQPPVIENSSFLLPKIINSKYFIH